jgi:cytochrome c oxidase subunit I+III
VRPATARAALDVGELPDYAFGHRSLLWWATMCMIAIEGTVFALAIGAYLFLKGRNPHWPPAVDEPRLLWGTLNLIILLASTVPNELAKRAAQRFDLGPTRLWMATALVMALAFNIVRFVEFSALNVRWDTNAYGSIVWTLLGLHTVHVLTDFLDSSVLAALIFVGPVEERRFVDVAENAMYWYFVVFSWIPVYAVIYLVPRIV